MTSSVQRLKKFGMAPVKLTKLPNVSRKKKGKGKRS
jgi:hypothetical protein